MASLRVNLVIFSVFLVLLGVSAQPKWQPRIIGERIVAKNELPYLAGIFHFNGFFTENLGSAVILNSRIILSSASNIDGFVNNLDKVIAVLGSPLVDENRHDEMVSARIEQIILHQQFDANTRAFDLALLRTKEQIVFSNAIHPIALPMTDLNVENELQASISGWGLSEVSWIIKASILEQSRYSGKIEFIFFTIFLQNSRNHSKLTPISHNTLK